MKTKTSMAWAVHTQSREGHGFIGPYYLSAWRDAGIPDQLRGYGIALFRTRREARAALDLVKGPEWGFKHARVYRVTVTVEGVPA